MKHLTIILISLLCTITQSQSDEKKFDEQTVKQLIQKVKQSQGDERRKAMNALKVQLRSMNRVTRKKVMVNLQKSFATKQHGGTQRGVRHHGTAKNYPSGSGQNFPSQQRFQTGAPQTPPHTTPSIPPNRPHTLPQNHGQKGGRR